MTLVASSIKSILSTLDTNGKLLEALRLHSITFISFSLARNWILKGPLMRRAPAIFLAIFLIRLAVSTYSFCGGNCMVASPECTPAYSTCSEIAYARTSPSSATASNSISLHLCMNWLITTGCSFDTSAASERKWRSLCSS